MKRLGLVLLLLTAGCDALPRDTEGTTERVKEGVIRLGRVEGAPDPKLDALVAALARETGAQVQETRGPTEPLMLRLETGRLDLVVGSFDKNTPWIGRVSFSKPVVTVEGPHGTEEAKAATQNGEHRWAMTVDRAARRIAEGGR